MGWDSTKKSRQQIFAQLAERYGNLGAVDPGGKSIWTVGTLSNRAEPIICCHLIEQHDGLTYVKTLTESEHPYYFDCPPEFFRIATEKCAPWRTAVRFLRKLPV